MLLLSSLNASFSIASNLPAFSFAGRSRGGGNSFALVKQTSKISIYKRELVLMFSIRMLLAKGSRGMAPQENFENFMF